MGFNSKRGAVALAVAAGLAVAGSYGLVHAAGGGNVQNSVTPCRLMDTRTGSTVGSRSTPIGAGETITVKVVGNNGNCTGIASDTTSVEVQLTSSDTSATSYLTAWPANLAQPTISQLNTRAGVVISNSTNVGLSPGR